MTHFRVKFGPRRGGPNKRLHRKLSVESLGAGLVVLKFAVLCPRPGIARLGCKTDLTCFSHPLPLCRPRISQR